MLSFGYHEVISALDDSRNAALRLHEGFVCECGSGFAVQDCLDVVGDRGDGGGGEKGLERNGIGRDGGRVHCEDMRGCKDDLSVVYVSVGA